MLMAVGARLNKEVTKTDEGTLALWEIVSVVVSCLIAEWVVLAFVGRSKLVLAIPIVLALTLMIVSHRAYGETLQDRVSLGQHCRGCKAVDSADTRSDRDCSSDIDKRVAERSTALAILAGTTVGVVSAVRIAGVHQPARADRVRSRLEEHRPGRSTIWRRSSSESSSVCSHFWRWGDLGMDLSTRAEPLRARAFTCSRLHNRCPFFSTTLD
jgi:hypothetical protein